MRFNKFILYKILVFKILFLFTLAVSGQSSLDKGNELFKNEEYCKAIGYYNSYLKEYSDKDVLFKRGVCNYECGNFKNAILDLENSKYLGNFDKEVNIYLAKIYHKNQEFDKAIIYYKKVLNDFDGDKEVEDEVSKNIKRCSKGIYIKFKPTDHFIENWGAEVNSQFDDILPIQSPNVSSSFYFSSNRGESDEKKEPFNEFKVDVSNGGLQKLPKQQGNIENGNTLFLDFYSAGEKAILFSGRNMSRGLLYDLSYNEGDLNNKNKDVFTGPIESKNGFRYVQFLNDSTIIFSSNREGGYGGYDIYITGHRKGYWFRPINLGPNINTEYDEISPYMSPDCKNIYFSTNSLNSVGGFDIVHSQFSYTEKQWLKPLNLGFPINSPYDEYGFRLLSNGKGGVFNSNRIDESFGGQDLYWVYFKNPIENTAIDQDHIPFLADKNLYLFRKIFKNKVAIGDENTSSDDSLLVRNSDEDEVWAKTVENTKKPTKDKNIDVPNSGKVNSKVVVGKSSEVGGVDTLLIPLIYLKNNTYKDKALVYDFLNRLGGLMKKYPAINVEIVGNVFSSNDAQSDLLSSVRVAQNFADSLVLRTIDQDRIIVRGVGNNFPAAKPHGAKRSKSIINRANNRLDIFLHYNYNTPVYVKRESFYLSNSLKDVRFELYRSILDGLSYKILVKRSGFLFINKLLSKYSDSWIETDGNHQDYYYTLGLFKKYSDAKKVYSEILSSGLKDIFIIPYIDARHITRREALTYAESYTDLVNYLEKK